MAIICQRVKMDIGFDLDVVRQRVIELIARHKPQTDLKTVSIAIGKNHAYLQQFLTRGTPRRLPENVRCRLAEYFGIEDEMLLESKILEEQANQPKEPTALSLYDGSTAPDLGIPIVSAIPEVRVAASAGGGSVADYEPLGDNWHFPSQWLRHELHARPSDLKIITIDGNSMEPVLYSGDKVLVDTSRTAPSPPGIFILHDGLGLVAKQIEHVPDSDPPRIRIRSANPDFQVYERTADEVRLIGRVIWFSRRL